MPDCAALPCLIDTQLYYTRHMCPSRYEEAVATAERALDIRFPEKAVAVGFNDLGDYLVLLPGKKNTLFEVVYWWDHETCYLDIIADSIDDLPDVPLREIDAE